MFSRFLARSEDTLGVKSFFFGAHNPESGVEDQDMACGWSGAMILDQLAKLLEGTEGDERGRFRRHGFASLKREHSRSRFDLAGAIYFNELD